MVVVRSMNDGGLDALRNRRFNRRQFCADAIDGIDDVGARLAEDHDGDRGYAVQISCRADVLRGVRNVGYIGEPDCGSVVVTDDERLVLSPHGTSGRW